MPAPAPANAKREKAAFLGVVTSVPAAGVREQLKLAKGVGLAVDFVEKDSPAEAAGLAKGDVLVGMSGRTIRTVDDVRAAPTPQGEADAVVGDKSFATKRGDVVAAPSVIPAKWTARSECYLLRVSDEPQATGSASTRVAAQARRRRARIGRECQTARRGVEPMRASANEPPGHAGRHFEVQMVVMRPVVIRREHRREDVRRRLRRL